MDAHTNEVRYSEMGRARKPNFHDLALNGQIITAQWTHFIVKCLYGEGITSEVFDPWV